MADSSETILLELKDETLTFTLKKQKDSLRILITNELSKFKHMALIKKDGLKKEGIKKSVKGLYRLLINGLSQTDKHIEIKVFYGKNDGISDNNETNDDNNVMNTDGNNVNNKILQMVEEYDIPNNSVTLCEQGLNLYFYLVYTSDYDEESEFLFTFTPIIEDDTNRLRDMARDRKLENENLELRVKELENQLSFKTSLTFLLNMKITSLRELSSMQSTRSNRKMVKKIQVKLDELALEIDFLDSNQTGKKKLLKDIEKVRNILLGKKSVSPFLETKLLTDDWQEQLLEWVEEKATCSLLYSATADGWDVDEFHSKCNDKERTFTVIKSENGCIFGGYNPDAWSSNGKYSKGKKEGFVFSLKNHKGDEPVRMINKGDKGAYNAAAYGPSFGEDLYIASKKCKEGTSNLGYAYAPPHGLKPGRAETRRYFCGDSKFNIIEIEVHEIN